MKLGEFHDIIIEEEQATNYDTTIEEYNLVMRYKYYAFDYVVDSIEIDHINKLVIIKSKTKN